MLATSICRNANRLGMTTDWHAVFHLGRVWNQPDKGDIRNGSVVQFAWREARSMRCEALPQKTLCVESDQTMTIDEKLIEIGLDKLDGDTFESFAQSVIAALRGIEFTPLGGMHDGGADGLMHAGVSQRTDKPHIFLQCSIEADYEGKIRRTLASLEKSRGKPGTLYHAAPYAIAKLDLEERRLEDLFDVTIRLYDRTWLVKHVNYNAASREAFETHIRPRLGYLKRMGTVPASLANSASAPSAVYVFLRQELERREGKQSLIVALADGLILKALEGTEPPAKLVNPDEVRERIAKIVPSARKLVGHQVKSRLEHLAAVKREARLVRRHGERYGLAYDIRRRVEDENAEDELTRVRVKDLWQQRLQVSGPRWRQDELERALEVCFETVQAAFFERGIEFAAFLEGHSRDQLVYIEDAARSAMERQRLTGKYRAEYLEAILETLRHAFFQGEPVERSYFHKLSLTYTLLFSLQTDQSVAGFFEGMAGDFYLYVGADVIVRALSEAYLPGESRLMSNALEIIRRAGGQLVLAERVLREVLGHIRETDRVYREDFEGLDAAIDLTVGRQADKILIRAYYYARNDPAPNIKPPPNWPAFINRLLPYADLNKQLAIAQFGDYLQAHFGLSFVAHKDLNRFVKTNERDELAARLASEKSSPALAENDAHMALAVYGRRRQFEGLAANRKHGYRTWWLTAESLIVNHTRDLVEREGASFLIRPEFLVSYLALAPNKGEVRETLNRVFPGPLGLSMARRVEADVLHGVLEALREAEALDPARRQAGITANSNKLKARYFGERRAETQRAGQPAVSGKKKSHNRGRHR